MMKKKKTEQSLQDELAQAQQQLSAMKEAYQELQFNYNRSCCKEQELNNQMKELRIEKEEAESKAKVLVVSLWACDG